MEQEEIDEENIETEEGREESLNSGGIDAREAAFLQGYENDSKDEEEDYGLEEDEKIED